MALLPCPTPPTFVRVARVIALFSLAGVFVYYRRTREVKPSLTLVGDDGNTMVTLSPDEFPRYQRLQEAGRDGSNPASSHRQQTVRKQALDVFDFVVIKNKVYPKNASLPRMTQWKYPLLKPSYGALLRQLDFSGYSKKERKFLESHVRVMVQRAEHLSQECSSVAWESTTTTTTTSSLNMIWDTKHHPNVLWCPIYKVASTTWSINFLRLAHFNDGNVELLKLPPKLREKMKFSVKYGATQRKASELYPPPRDLEDRARVFKNSLRVIIVRHPFSRLISAYRDKMQKMEPRPPQHKFRELQLSIIAKYRKPDSAETSPFPTFPEFIQHVIDSTKTLKTRKDWMTNVVCWRPYWVQCNVCATDYNLILKLETMEEDEKFLITLTGMEELRRLKAHEWRHLKRKTPSGELIKQYFSQLTVHQIQELHQQYLPDFLLFNYKVDEDLLASAKN
ncbi:carbohydrate sulfotransferase 10-like [Panulirus ornatus]|uniref:carbohydrate sulfotransferase 10-like n=1 Tax=Panulirus ornatus TaxID=150431 RepID=UPI003A8AA51A